MNKRLLHFAIGLIFTIFPLSSFAEDHPTEHHDQEEQHVESHDVEHGIAEAHDEHGEAQHGDEKFDPKTFIFHHIQDAHEWHITKMFGKEITIPLPIILYSSNSGFHVFLSNHLSHEHIYEHNGARFQLPHHGEYSGTIIELDQLDQVVTKEVEKKGETIVKTALPFDISITKNVVAIFVSCILLLWLFLSISKRYKQNALRAPKGAQSWMEPVIIFVRDEIAKPSIGHHYERFMPYLLTIFFFIWFNNMMGLIPIFPGGANLSGNITFTFSLAFITYLITQFSGNKNYWKHIFWTPGVPWWLKVPVPLMPVIELLGSLIKPITLMIRLFANITAGHIIVLSFFAMIFIFGEMSPAAGYGASPLIIAFTIFMTFLEFLVAAIQAYVFTMLSALYFGMATEEAHH